MKFVEWIKEMYSASSDTSSKRVHGSIGYLSFVATCVISYFISKDIEILYLLGGSALTLFGLTLFNKFAQPTATPPVV